MVNPNFMEVNEAAIASAIDQQVGSSLHWRKTKDGSSLLQGLKVVRGHTDWLPYWLEKLRDPYIFDGSKRTVISREMYLSGLRAAGRT